MNRTLDILMEEFKLDNDFSDCTMFDMLSSVCVDKKDVLSPIIIFLEKLYFLNHNLMYKKYGTTLRHLMEFGQFQISPYLANPASSGGLLYNGYAEDQDRMQVDRPPWCPGIYVFRFLEK